MDQPASQYLEADLVPWSGFLFALWRNLAALVGHVVVFDLPHFGRPCIVRVRVSATGRQLAEYRYGATESRDALDHLASLKRRLAEMSLPEFCDDVGITLQPDDLRSRGVAGADGAK